MNELRDLFSSLGPFLLYAEIHSKLPLIPNILNNRLPEILADAPIRISRNNRLPILILVKDAHLYPIELISVRVEIFQAGEKRRDVDLLTETIPLARRLWYRLFEIDPGTEGPVDIDVIFTVRRKNKVFELRNHSYPSGQKRKLRVYLSSDDLPDSRRIIYGDIHYHSSYTEDVVEFGAPIEATARMAKAVGLSFFAVTDHSFDLDNDPTDPTRNDPDLRKWRLFLEDCAAVDGKDVTVLPGIEVSAGNAKGRNVHLLILNPERFYHGQGDSGEVWFKNKPDDSVAEILKRLDPAELPIAAHPFNKIPLAQKCLLRRGTWGSDDVRQDNLAGLQIFNGDVDKDLKKSLKKWVALLLRGEKKFIYAGNDAHGNFNRQIRVKIPFFWLKDESSQIFGFMKTGIPSSERLDGKTLVAQLRRGRCFVTTGPSIVYHLYDADGTYLPGDEARGTDLRVFLEIKSIREFGKITSVSIISGDLAARTEKAHVLRVHEPEFAFDGRLPFVERPGRYYIRIACEAENGMALSNPIWITNGERDRPSIANPGRSQV